MRSIRKTRFQRRYATCCSFPRPIVTFGKGYLPPASQSGSRFTAVSHRGACYMPQVRKVTGLSPSPQRCQACALRSVLSFLTVSNKRFIVYPQSPCRGPVIAKNGDISISYHVRGEGAPVILIHGLGYPGKGWFLQVPELSRRFRVITMDNRGSGRSDRPDDRFTHIPHPICPTSFIFPHSI